MLLHCGINIKSCESARPRLLQILTFDSVYLLILRVFCNENSLRSRYQSVKKLHMLSNMRFTSLMVN